MEGRDYLAIFVILLAVVAFCAYLLYLRWRWCRKWGVSFWTGDSRDREDSAAWASGYEHVNCRCILPGEYTGEVMDLDDWLAADPPLWDW